MASRFQVKPPAQQQPNPFLPNLPPDPLVCEQFDGINTQTTRPGVEDKQMAWCDTFMPISQRKLRTMYDVGTPITFASGTVSFFAFANIGATPYCIAVMADGSVIATNTETLSQATIAVAGTIQNPSRLNVGITQYGSQYVIIVADQTDGYFIWDGATFYEPGDTGPGGGTMPSAIGGTAVEIYSGRVWIANGATITFSAPGDFEDFATASGGGNFTSTDSFLRVRFIQLLQTNGFLYLIADSSINYISGVQTSGSPPTTTFTNQNADPEVGTPWPSTVNTFGRNILFANAWGAHVSYGAAVTKISDMLDGVYNTVDNFGGLVPSAAKAIVFGKRIWLLLMPIIDPISGQQVNKLFCWDSKRWWAASQSVTLTYIQNQEIDSVLTAWGSTGTAIYPLFQTASGSLTKTFQTRLWDKPGGYQFLHTNNRLWALTEYYSLVNATLTVSIDNENAQSGFTVDLLPNGIAWTNNAGNPIVWMNNTPAVMTWYNAGVGTVVMPPQAVGQAGVLQGITLTTEAEDMSLISIMMDSQIAAYRG